MGTGAEPLGALADNGGPTFTHALLEGSPAIDKIPEEDCKVGTDQRGVVRPQNLKCDIGAFEAGDIDAPPVASDQLVGTASDSPVAVKLEASDANGDPLSFTITSLPASGDLSEDGIPIDMVPHTLDGSGDTVTYTPHGGATGIDSFKFKANDGAADSNIATVTILVIGRVNAVPLAFDNAVKTTVDTPVSIVLDGAPMPTATL